METSPAFFRKKRGLIRSSYFGFSDFEIFDMIGESHPAPFDLLREVDLVEDWLLSEISSNVLIGQGSLALRTVESASLALQELCEAHRYVDDVSISLPAVSTSEGTRYYDVFLDDVVGPFNISNDGFFLAQEVVERLDLPTFGRPMSSRDPFAEDARRSCA